MFQLSLIENQTKIIMIIIVSVWGQQQGQCDLQNQLSADCGRPRHLHRLHCRLLSQGGEQGFC